MKQQRKQNFQLIDLLCARLKAFGDPQLVAKKKKIVFYAKASIFFGSVFHQLAGKWLNLKDTFS